MDFFTSPEYGNSCKVSTSVSDSKDVHFPDSRENTMTLNQDFFVFFSQNFYHCNNFLKINFIVTFDYTYAY